LQNSLHVRRSVRPRCDKKFPTEQRDIRVIKMKKHSISQIYMHLIVSWWRSAVVCQGNRPEGEPEPPVRERGWNGFAFCWPAVWQLTV